MTHGIQMQHQKGKLQIALACIFLTKFLFGKNSIVPRFFFLENNILAIYVDSLKECPLKRKEMKQTEIIKMKGIFHYIN